MAGILGGRGRPPHPSGARGLRAGGGRPARPPPAGPRAPYRSCRGTVPTPGSQAPPAARARGAVPAVGARGMARGPSRSGRPRIPGSRLSAGCALGTFRSQRRRPWLPFQLRFGSRTGSAGCRVPAAPSVCRGEAAASLPPWGARRLHRGNHGDQAHPGRAASLKGQDSHRGNPLPWGPRWEPGRWRPSNPHHPARPEPPRPPLGEPQAGAGSGWGCSAAGERRLSPPSGPEERLGWRVGAAGKVEDAFPEEITIGKGAGH